MWCSRFSFSVHARSIFLGLGVVLATTTVFAHTTNRGKATFSVRETGDIAIRIDVELKDLQELSATELVPATYWDDAEASTQQLVFKKLTKKAPRWMRLTGDGQPCPVTFSGVLPLGKRGASIRLVAKCDAMPKILRVDWGIAKMTGFDLVAVTLVTAPGSIRHTSVLSAKTPKLEVTVASPSLVSTLSRFLLEGIVHILIGWDHLLFLLALVLGCRTIKQLLLVVSGFTLAHSVTLALGVLNIVTLPPTAVEATIALSIAVAAGFSLYRLRNKTLPYPGSAPSEDGQRAVIEVALAAGFGLVHGLGFATMLAAQMGANDSVALPLLGFNVGVELGQLACVVVAFPLLAWLGRRKVGPTIFGALFVGLIGVGVTVAALRIFEG